MQSTSPQPDLRVTVLLFAGLRDALDSDCIEVSIPFSTGQEIPCVADLLQACTTQYPIIANWLPHIRIAVNWEYSTPKTPLRYGDEIAFIPPVAGGYT